jgi:hypothetical protein
VTIDYIACNANEADCAKLNSTLINATSQSSAARMAATASVVRACFGNTGLFSWHLADALQHPSLKKHIIGETAELTCTCQVQQQAECAQSATEHPNLCTPGPNHLTAYCHNCCAQRRCTSPACNAPHHLAAGTHSLLHRLQVEHQEGQ